MALTERQKEIKKLLDQGKTPREIGEALGISENAVYQHRRRMGVKKTGGNRRGATAKPAAAKKTAAKKTSTGRQQPRKRSQQRPQPAAASASAVDPLTAVRNRRTEVAALIGGAKTEAEQARKTADQAEKAYKDALSKVQTELDQLDTAEAVLTGKLKPPTKAPRKSAANNHKAEDKPAAPAPAPAAEAPEEQQAQPQEAAAQPAQPEAQPEDATQPEAETQPEAQPEAEAQDAAAEAADEPTEVSSQDGQANTEEERPGAPTLPEFQQEDAFAS